MYAVFTLGIWSGTDGTGHSRSRLPLHLDVDPGVEVVGADVDVAEGGVGGAAAAAAAAPRQPHRGLAQRARPAGDRVPRPHHLVHSLALVRAGRENI